MKMRIEKAGGYPIEFFNVNVDHGILAVDGTLSCREDALFELQRILLENWYPSRATLKAILEDADKRKSRFLLTIDIQEKTWKIKDN